MLTVQNLDRYWLHALPDSFDHLQQVGVESTDYMFLGVPTPEGPDESYLQLWLITLSLGPGLGSYRVLGERLE